MFYIQRRPHIKGNTKLREPQIEGYEQIKKSLEEGKREIGLVLPVGCGKSGLITLSPFSIPAKRSLVIAPNLTIRDELFNNFYINNEKYFYKRTAVILEDGMFPEPAKVSSDKNTHPSILEGADVVIANIDQLSSKKNHFSKLSSDFFDLILVDEAHHNVAESWEKVRNHFNTAKIVNFSATPERSDGKAMSGEIVYVYPIAKALEKNYVKDIEAWVINPETLSYLNKKTGEKYEMSVDDIREKAKNDSEFRHSVIQSQETIDLIVDSSIQALKEIREKTGENKHAIIASAQNYDHCHEIVKNYHQKNQRVDFVHSREDSEENDKILKKLKNNELDVIVQVSKLGEGFDHPYLSVAAVFKIYRSMSPFIQFLGRIMRKTQESKEKGIFIFHLGTNIAELWDDFKKFSEADQEYFKTRLAQLRDVEFKKGEKIKKIGSDQNTFDDESNEVSNQSNISLTKNNLSDPDLDQAIDDMINDGYSPDEIQLRITKRYATRQDKLEAERKALNGKVQNLAGKVLAKRTLSHDGHDLDKARIGKTNYQVIISEINKLIKSKIGKERQSFDLEDSKNAKKLLPDIETELLNKQF